MRTDNTFRHRCRGKHPLVIEDRETDDGSEKKRRTAVIAGRVALDIQLVFIGVGRLKEAFRLARCQVVNCDSVMFAIQLSISAWLGSASAFVRKSLIHSRFS